MVKATADGDAKARPCPFCGKEVHLDERYAFYGATGELATPVMHVVGCLSCKIFMWDLEENRLLERWNTRATS